MGMVAVLWAESGIRPYQDLIDVDPGSRGFNTYVNVVNGNLIHIRPEFTIPGRGLPLSVVFTYNSTNPKNGPFGYGWQMNYALRYGTDNDSGDVSITRADGRVDLFVKQADGTFEPTLGVRDRLDALRIGPTEGITLSVWGDFEDGANSKGDSTIYTFDSPNHTYATEIEDRNGNTLTLSYSDDGLLTTVTDGSGRKVRLEYANNRLAKLTDPGARQWRYEYDANGNMIKCTDPLGGATQYTYNAENHQCLSITDTRGGVFQFAYNADGAVTGITDPLGNMAFSFGYLDCCMTIVTNGNGHDTTYSYDEQSRVTAIEDALGSKISRTWDDAYHLSALTNAKGNTTTYTYNTRGNLLTRTDPLDNMLSYTWDQIYNNVTSYTDGNGNTTTYAYGTQGNLASKTDALGATTTYTVDSYGQISAITNARGYTTTFAYDEFGNLIRAVDALGGETVFTYDALGNPLSKTNPNQNTTTYEYDLLGRLTQATTPLGHQWQFAYDTNGNRVQRTDANGDTTSYTYDALNQRTKTTYPDGHVVWEYDAVGNLLGAKNNRDLHDETLYEYDALNRIISQTLDYGGAIAAGTVRYEDDSAGQRIKTTYPDGENIRYRYDKAGRLIRVEDFAGTTIYTRDAAGRKTKMDYPNGATVAYEYDDNNRTTGLRVTDPDGRVFVDRTYTYDETGNKTGEIHAEDDTDRDIQYDALNRITSVTYHWPETEVYQYTYDPAGNRLTETVNGEVTTFVYDADGRVIQQITPTHTINFAYDRNGNRIRQTGTGTDREYFWDYENRMTGCNRLPSGDSFLTFAYSAQGLKLRKIGNGLEFYYSYDGARLISEVMRSYVFLYNPGISVKDGNLFHYVMYNNAGISVAEIFPWASHSVVFDEFGLPQDNLSKGSLDPLTLYGSSIFDRDLQIYWNGYDPVTATNTSDQDDLLERSPSVDIDAAILGPTSTQDDRLGYSLPVDVDGVDLGGAPEDWPPRFGQKEIICECGLRDRGYDCTCAISSDENRSIP